METSTKPTVATLPKEQLKTGEEDERTLVTVFPVKLFLLAAEQWQERGKGTLKLNYNPSTQKSRLRVLFSIHFN